MVLEGTGKAVVIAVGPHSAWGQIQARIDEPETPPTPLQENLERLAELIGTETRLRYKNEFLSHITPHNHTGKIGLGAAIITFLALLIKWIVTTFIQEGSVRILSEESLPITLVLIVIKLLFSLLKCRC